MQNYEVDDVTVGIIVDAASRHCVFVAEARESFLKSRNVRTRGASVGFQTDDAVAIQIAAFTGIAAPIWRSLKYPTAIHLLRVEGEYTIVGIVFPYRS